MSETKLSVLTRAIVEFEENVKRIKHDTSDNAKYLINRAEALSGQFDQVARAMLEEVEKSIESEKANTINEMRKKFNEERESLLKQLRQRAEKNVDNAVEEVLKVLEGAYK
ncbi:hypothetical protein GWK48_04780 [Metallosphaera tengchongensis]|uniref:Uncharacterized protein n=1 Tax=Metallosphaera tengchongensis TaxID=1532350 RepID=A0A6N0NST4_9CREN|nr:hypothetical protein [Metallosphaera tengchongensis]QKQ99795.1 hypothetical protein GWK48_04780 [Metallosphaera tengchongensis]